MKKQVIFLIINYLLLASLLFLVMFSHGCSSIPDLTARVELNTCENYVQVDPPTIPAIYPYLEIAFDDGNFKLSSSNICFSFYLFNANRDTLFSRSFKVLGKNNIEFLNLLK